VNTFIEKKNIELSENLSQTATKINVENKDTKPNLVIETQKNPEQKSATTVIELISPINNRTPENKKETTEDSTKKEIPETKNSDQKLVTKNNGTEGLLKNTVITVSATESKKSQDLLKQTNIELTAINKTGSTTNFFNVSTSSTTINNNQTIITENPSAKLSLQQEDKAPSCLSWFFCLGKRNTKNDEKEHLLKNQTPN
jgi:cell envelope opacity-associated protein A